MNVSSAEAVLVIGAGPGQSPLIEGFASRGYAVLAVDRDPDAPGLRLAGGAIPCSTHDVDAVLAALRRHPLATRLIAVACPTTGQPYLTASSCAEMLGLPFASVSAVKALLDKHELWRALDELGLTRRECVTVARGQDPARVALPVVVKPARGGGASEGVTFCSKGEELQHAIDVAASCSRDGRALVESFVPGREHKVAGVLRGGEIMLLLAGQRTFGDDARRLPVAVALGRTTNGTVAALGEQLRAPLSDVCRHLGLRDAPLNVDVIDSPSGPEIIDFDISLGSMNQLLERSAGIDPIEMHVALALRRPWSSERHWWRGAATTYLWVVGDSLSAELLRQRCEAAAESRGEAFLPDPWVRRGRTISSKVFVRVGGLITEGGTQEEALERGSDWLEEIEEAIIDSEDTWRVLHPGEEV